MKLNCPGCNAAVTHAAESVDVTCPQCGMVFRAPQPSAEGADAGTTSAPDAELTEVTGQGRHVSELVQLAVTGLPPAYMRQVDAVVDAATFLGVLQFIETGHTLDAADVASLESAYTEKLEALRALVEAIPEPACPPPPFIAVIEAELTERFGAETVEALKAYFAAKVEELGTAFGAALGENAPTH